MTINDFLFLFVLFTPFVLLGCIAIGMITKFGHGLQDRALIIFSCLMASQSAWPLFLSFAASGNRFIVLVPAISIFLLLVPTYRAKGRQRWMLILATFSSLWASIVAYATTHNCFMGACV